MAISTNGTVITRLAGALYNTQMSNATYEEVKALDPASLANALYARDFSSATDATVATTLVTNLGLTAVEGLANWVAAQLTAAGSHKGAKVVELLNGFAQMSADATYGAAATAFNTKVDAALAASQTTGNAGGTFAAAGVVSGKTFTLTTDADDVSGTNLDDTITGGVDTLGTDDVIDGGDGDDTMTMRMDATGGMGIVSNVETIEIISRGAGTSDFVDVSGMTNLVLRDGTANYTVTTFDQATASLTLENADDDITVGFDDVSGDADELALTVDGFEGDLLIDTSGLESVAINASGDASDFTLTDETTATITDITITGSVDVGLTIAAATDALETIDASDATGDNTYDVSAVELDISVTGGSGDETLTFAATLNTSDTIDGGAGDDTLTAEVDAATTVRPTISNVESVELNFSAAGTFDARNTTGITSLELSGITAAATVTRLASTVTALSITEDTATADAISVTYASGADTVVTLTIGATNDDGDAVADLGAITIAGNDGALTISSEGDADNLVDAVDADDAASLTIDATTTGLTTTTISAGAADSVTIDATAGDIETTTIAAAAATTFTLNAIGGGVTVTDATLTDATTIALNATGGAIATGDLTTAADAAEVTVVADGDDANDVTIDLIDADFATSFVFTATDGADITVTDIETLGEDSDAADVDNAITITATGVDADDDGSTVEVAIDAFDAAGVIDVVTLVSDADGTVSFTIGAGTDITVSEVDATDSEGITTIDLSGVSVATEVSTGAGGSTTTLTSAADTFVGGEGDDEVTGGDGADDITLGEGSDTVIFTTAVTADTVQDFNVDDDLIQVSVGDIGSDLVDGNGDSLVADTSITLQSQASTATTDIAVGTQILVFTDDLVNATAMLGALDALAFAAAGTPADNDDILVLWTDGSDTFLSSVNVLITGDAIDDAGVTNTTIATFVGVSIGDLAAANFEFI